MGGTNRRPCQGRRAAIRTRPMSLRFGVVIGLIAIPFGMVLASTMLFSYAKARNMVFPRCTGHVALSCHDEITKSKRTRARGTRMARHLSHFQFRGLF